MREGWTQVDIAAKLGRSQALISMDWKVVVQQVQAEQSEDAKAVIAVKVAQLQLIQKEAYDAWLRSKAPACKQVDEELQSLKQGGGGYNKTIKTQEFQVGDKGFLDTCVKAILTETQLKGYMPDKKTLVQMQATVGMITGAELMEALAALPDKVPDPLAEALKRIEHLPKVERQASEVLEPGQLPNGLKEIPQEQQQDRVQSVDDIKAKIRAVEARLESL